MLQTAPHSKGTAFVYPVVHLGKVCPAKDDQDSQGIVETLRGRIKVLSRLQQLRLYHHEIETWNREKFHSFHE